MFNRLQCIINFENEININNVKKLTKLYKLLGRHKSSLLKSKNVTFF